MQHPIAAAASAAGFFDSRPATNVIRLNQFYFPLPGLKTPALAYRRFGGYADARKLISEQDG